MKANIKQGGRLAVAVLFTVAGLVACGGSDNPAPAPAPSSGPIAPAPAPTPGVSNTVPASAGTSVAAYIAYLRGLKSDETSEPVSVGQFTAPVDNTAPPTSLGS